MLADQGDLVAPKFIEITEKALYINECFYALLDKRNQGNDKYYDFEKSRDKLATKKVNSWSLCLGPF